MNGPTEHPYDRRQWLGSSLRYAAVAGISLFSAGLLMRRGADAAAGHCHAPVDCGNCSARRGCQRAQRK